MPLESLPALRCPRGAVVITQNLERKGMGAQSRYAWEVMHGGKLAVRGIDIPNNAVQAVGRVGCAGGVTVRKPQYWEDYK